MFDILKDILSIVVKSLVGVVFLFILAKFMGKKQIAQLSLFDYIVGISIGSVAAALSVDKRISLLDGVVSMIIWALFPVVISTISVHSMSARRLLEGTPVVLIQNGKIIEKNLKKSKLTVNDLLEELRVKSIFDIADVNYAILENNGLLSVLLKSSKQPATSADLNIKSQESSVAANVIIDGELQRNNMVQMNISEAWLLNELRKKKFNSVSEVLLATCNANMFFTLTAKAQTQTTLKYSNNKKPDSFVRPKFFSKRQ